MIDFLTLELVIFYVFLEFCLKQILCIFALYHCFTNGVDRRGHRALARTLGGGSFHGRDRPPDEHLQERRGRQGAHIRGGHQDEDAVVVEEGAVGVGAVGCAGDAHTTEVRYLDTCLNHFAAGLVYRRGQHNRTDFQYQVGIGADYQGNHRC